VEGINAIKTGKLVSLSEQVGRACPARAQEAPHNTSSLMLSAPARPHADAELLHLLLTFSNDRETNFPVQQSGATQLATRRSW
jgi:hypothetical protein